MSSLIFVQFCQLYNNNNKSILNLSERNKEDAKMKLVEDNIKLVGYTLTKVVKISKSDHRWEDAYSEGLLGLCIAANKYDENNGAPFASYAISCIKNQAYDYLTRSAGFKVTMPRLLTSVARDAIKFNDIEKAAEKFGVSVELATKYLKTYTKLTNIVSLDYEIHEAGDGEGVKISDIIHDNSDEYTLCDVKNILSDAMADMHKKRKQAIEMLYFKEMTQVDIAEKMGTSQMQVSRYIKDGLRDIKELIEYGCIETKYTQRTTLIHEGEEKTLTEWSKICKVPVETMRDRINKGLPSDEVLKKKNKVSTLTFNGETLTIAEWVKRTGLSSSAIYYRIEKGYPVEKILSKENFRHEIIRCKKISG